MPDAPRIPRDEPYAPLPCLVGVLVANILLWAVLIELGHLAATAWRWATG
jgi:hypothetical protein